MTSNQVQCAVADNNISFFQLNPAIANGFDFPSFQYHAGFVLFFDKIIVKGFFILYYTHAGMKWVGITRFRVFYQFFDITS